MAKKKTDNGAGAREQVNKRLQERDKATKGKIVNLADNVARAAFKGGEIAVSIPQRTRRRRQFWTRPGASSPISACRSTASGSICTVTAGIASHHTTITCTTFAKGSRSPFSHWARRGG